VVPAQRITAFQGTSQPILDCCAFSWRFRSRRRSRHICWSTSEWRDTAFITCQPSWSSWPWGPAAPQVPHRNGARSRCHRSDRFASPLPCNSWRSRPCSPRCSGSTRRITASPACAAALTFLFAGSRGSGSGRRCRTDHRNTGGPPTPDPLAGHRSAGPRNRLPAKAEPGSSGRRQRRATGRLIAPIRLFEHGKAIEDFDRHGQDDGVGRCRPQAVDGLSEKSERGWCRGGRRRCGLSRSGRGAPRCSPGSRSPAACALGCGDAGFGTAQ
jgi:hypothetical protein